MGNKFVLATDHKPLIALFGEKRGITQMAVGRLQCWELFLSDLITLLNMSEVLKMKARTGFQVY